MDSSVLLLTRKMTSEEDTAKGLGTPSSDSDVEKDLDEPEVEFVVHRPLNGQMEDGPSNGGTGVVTSSPIKYLSREVLLQENELQAANSLSNSVESSAVRVTFRKPLGPLLTARIPCNSLKPINYTESLHSDIEGSSDSCKTWRTTITDLDGWEGQSLNFTTSALKRCKSVVLQPYFRLLTFISWRPFGKESITPQRLGWDLLNFIYPVTVVLLLLYTYVYEVVSCQWKLNVRTDTRSITEIPIVTAMTVVPAAKIISNNTITSSSGAVTIPTTTTTTFNPYLPGPPYGPHSASGSTLSPKNKTLTDGVGIPDVNDAVCEHIITTYIIPNFLHFVAFVMGYFYFRIQDNEQLYALMEKVFLQAGPSQGKVASQSNMIKRLRLFLALGAVWVLAVMALQVLFVAVFGIDQRNVLSRAGTLGQWILFGIELVGIIIVNSVNLAVIINFATQCEMLIFFIKGISTKLQEKSMDLKSAMKDVLMVRHSIGSLNGPMSQMTSLAAIRFAELTIIGLCILILNHDDQTWVWVYRSIFPCVWAAMLLFPMIQAARINATCSKFKQIALETRVFGYQNNSQLDLDSFLLFISNTRLRAKLFNIPMKPSYLVGILVLVSFILLLLFQTSLIGPGGQIF